MEKYYKFEKDMINNYKNIDIFNINQIINNNDIIKDISKRNDGKTISQIFKNLMDIYKKMKSRNQIKLTLKIEEEDINNNIYILDNTNHDFLKELNESNIDLFINNKKYKFQKYLNQIKKDFIQS